MAKAPMGHRPEPRPLGQGRGPIGHRPDPKPLSPSSGKASGAHAVKPGAC